MSMPGTYGNLATAAAAAAAAAAVSGSAEQ